MSTAHFYCFKVGEQVGEHGGRCAGCPHYQPFPLPVEPVSRAQCGKQFRSRRVARGFSTPALARVVGADKSTVSRWDGGELPSSRCWPGLLRALGTEIIVSMYRAKQFASQRFADACERHRFFMAEAETPSLCRLPGYARIRACRHSVATYDRATAEALASGHAAGPAAPPPSRRGARSKIR